MVKRACFILLAASAILVGLYPILYFIIDRRFGLLALKTDALLANTIWNIFFYIHIVSGGIALLIGWAQFVTKWRTRNLPLHRQIGKVYVTLALVSAVTAIYIALFATGGLVTSIGFSCMGIVWFFTTLKGYRDIRKMNVISHQKMMIYSYAACLSAVTLRIYLPILIEVFDDFYPAYTVVSWLSWVPNLIVGYFIIRQLYPRGIIEKGH